MNKVLFEKKINNIVLKIIMGDLTKEKVDAIVNAANSYLSHGGGVAAAIVKAGGYQIQKESDEYIKNNGIIKTGEVAVTKAGSLPVKYVIHTVGPVWHGGNDNEEKLLYNSVFNSFKKADEMKLSSISLPAISSGIFGYPFEKACKTYLKAVNDFSKISLYLKEMRFCFLEKNRAFTFMKIIGG
ncbi:Appr-1-p processing protein [Marinitoga sp. 1197]|uniref:macro domain-containing protein n=1 Tax=Marinitoga sp. 1197 TaxID=1428449 RepID=UPI00064147C4|nr:macro domain-containing protein [Marinitoga sp. 1197]KLO22782.1 Appr-1-p processing protein [Marinitoga sp. 1197]